MHYKKSLARTRGSSLDPSITKRGKFPIFICSLSISKFAVERIALMIWVAKGFVDELVRR